MFNEIIQKVAKENNITYETAYKIISDQFHQVRDRLSNSGDQTICVANLLTFNFNTRKASAKLNALLSIENKKKYSYDQIESLTKKGATPFKGDY